MYEHLLDSALQRTQYPIGEVRELALGFQPERSELYSLVPKDRHAHGHYRWSIAEAASRSKEVRSMLVEACRQDVLFFASTMCWIFEPRTAARLPLNTWSDQDQYLLWLNECFGERDAAVEKSRGIGFSWNIAILSYYHWYFDDNCQIGLVSRTEDAVDLMDDPDSLMWKLDFLHKSMPEWWRRDMLKRTYADHRFVNLENGSGIIGYEATGNVMTGGRKRAIFLDEFGKFDNNQQQAALDSVQHVSNCRYFISTFKGARTKFWSMMRQEKSSMLKIIADWRSNPERAKGAYRVNSGVVEILDDEYDFPDDYRFVVDGPFFRENKIRSVWYDAECARTGATPKSIAEELDRESEAPGTKLFSPDLLGRLDRETVRRPVHEGVMDWDSDTFEVIWVPRRGGSARLWRPTNSMGQLTFGGPYAVGCDPAVGSGAEMANLSSLQVVDIQTGEQVLEVASNRISSIELAQLAFAVCKWLSKDQGVGWAYLNWESNGIGTQMTAEIKRLGWANKYVQEVAGHMTHKKRGFRLGWHNHDAGEGILSEMQRAMSSGELVVRSAQMVEDCRHYQRNEKSKVEHTGFLLEGGAGRSHGDRACALAIAWMAAKDRPASKPTKEAMPYKIERRKIDHDSEWWDEIESELVA